MYTVTTAMATSRGAGSVDGVRGYIRALREGRSVTQGAAAQAAGLSLRSYTDWELGRTDEIKTGPLMRLLSTLEGSAEHIRRLIEGRARVAEGEELARQQLAIPPEKREVMIEAIDTLRGDGLTNPEIHEIVRLLTQHGGTLGNAEVVLNAFLVGYRLGLARRSEDP